jgi:hypothetical protein
MDSTVLSTMLRRIVAVVPDRSVRAQSGTPFACAAAPAEGPAPQVASLGRLLHWLTPLSALNEDDQRALGVLALHGKGARRDDEDEADDEREEFSLPT